MFEHEAMWPADRLREYLQPQQLIAGIHVLTSVDSTNKYAKALARDVAGETALVVADTQTAGLGRGGKGWFSPPKAGLWFSLLLRPAVHHQALSLLSLGAAVAVAGAIRDIADVRAQLKWPNDVLIEGKKVCGILLESEFSAEKLSCLVVGIGINVNMTRDHFPQDIAGEATSLRIATGTAHRRMELLRAVVLQFERMYRCFECGDCESICTQWKNNTIFTARPVTIATGQTVFSGVFHDVDTCGRLVLRAPDGRLASFHSGSILAY